MRPIFKTLCMGLAVLALEACDKSETETSVPGPAGVSVSRHVYLGIRDTTGVDLLNPQSPGVLREFQVYYLKNGNLIGFSQPNWDAPDGYSIIRHPLDDRYYLQIVLDAGPGIEQTTTIVQLGNGAPLDTIITQYRPDPVNIQPIKLWHNGELVWDIEAGERKFEIVR
jgi:hypothetical protein